MEQYISKSAVVAEIKKMCKEAEWAVQCATYKEILSFINTLEVKDVDLEKEIQTFSMELSMKENNGDWEKDIRTTAKYFFELGMVVGNKAQKEPVSKDFEEREKRMKECPYRRVECTMYDDSIFECKGACSWVVDYIKLKELKALKGEDV